MAIGNQWPTTANSAHPPSPKTKGGGDAQCARGFEVGGQGHEVPATSRPAWAANQASAERAFIMVSAVVNVLDAMMNKVFSALSP